MKRGEVWLVMLDPTVGSEIRKARPCAIVSPDALNVALRTVIVSPLTSGSRPARFRVASNFAGEPGLIVAEHTRSVDKVRLLKHLGRLDAATLANLLHVLRELFKD